MTELPTSLLPSDEASAAARRARAAQLSRGRTTPSRRSTKRRHPAQGARIAAAGLGATTMFGLVGVMGYNSGPAAPPAPGPTATASPVSQPQVVVVVHRTGATDSVAASFAPSSRATTLTARPTVRPASSQAQAPAASTSGSR